MNERSIPHLPVFSPSTRFAARRWLAAWLALALLCGAGLQRAAAQDKDYVGISGLIAEADQSEADGKADEARAKYTEARKELLQLQKDHPSYNAKAVAFRLDYLAEKIAGQPKSKMPVPSATESTPSVRLLDAGAAPRKVFRLHPAVSDKQTMTMTIGMTMNMSLGDKQMPAINIPAMILTADSVVKDVSAGGDIAYSIVFSDASVSPDADTQPAVAEAMKKSLAGMVGVTGSGVMSANGITRDIQMKAPADASAQLKQSLAQAEETMKSSATPLPGQAVGVGARWEYKTRVKSQQGITLDQTATYELVSVEGEVITLHAAIAQSAASQKIESPAMPGMKMDLDKLTGTASGTSTLDLAHILPKEAGLGDKIDMTMSVNLGQQKQEMGMNLDMKITLESK